MYLILVSVGLLMPGLTAMAQNTDSLVFKEHILLQEDKRYIQMAQRDNIISSTQADSLRRITSGSVEKPLQIGIDILFQIRDYIDHEYEEQMMIVNEPVMEENYYTANRMLPSKLGMPDGYLSPEEMAEVRQKQAMDQLTESIARDLEGEKLPAWQEWCIKYIPFFAGSRAWYKGEVVFINGQEFCVPGGDPRDM
jgi:hypothetical protein